MKNIKVYINKFIALALTSTIVITTSGCSGKNNKVSTLETEKFTIESTQPQTEIQTQPQTEIQTETQIETQTQPQTEIQTETQPQTEAPTQNIPLEQPTTVSPLTPETNIESENEVIAFFEGISNKANTWIESENFENIKEDVTEGLATFILFLSNDSTIGGYTFSSLTDEGKEKVKILFVSMDTKLEEKFPGYKEKIGEKWNVVKVFVSEKYVNIKDSVKEYVIGKVGEESYDEFMNGVSEGWIDMKDSFSITFDFLGQKVKSLGTNIVDWAKEKKNYN